MAKSLNPHASHRSTAPVEQPAPVDPPRRGILAAGLALVIGGVVSLFPFAAGMLVFLDPILKKKASAGLGGAGGRPLRRVSSTTAIPADGTPIQVPVIADLTDAWSRELNQPVGAVYLRNQGGQIECFNAICPHAGCFVGYSTERKVFQCPCHTSSFQLDGSRILPSPSPRDMDKLKVDEEKLKAGEVWVEFVNYYPGKENREAKP